MKLSDGPAGERHLLDRSRRSFRGPITGLVCAVLVLLSGCGPSSSPSGAGLSTSSSSAPTVLASPTAVSPQAQAASTDRTVPAAGSSPRASPTQSVSPDTVASAPDGQRIFDAGIGPNRQPIPFSGGSTMMMMTTTTCAGCHGQDGHGQRTQMFAAPNITYRNLTAPDGMIEANGEHGMVYTDALIRRAVTQGLGADGDALNTSMPRWQLTDAEWADLVAYLKTLP